MTDSQTVMGTSLVEARIAVPDAASARRIAETLVARDLAACVQVLGPMLSVYSWQKEVHKSEEWLLLAKTTETSFPGLAEVVASLHRYEVPEIIAVPVSHSLASYAEWVRARSHAGGGPDRG